MHNACVLMNENLYKYMYACVLMNGNQLEVSKLGMNYCTGHLLIFHWATVNMLNFATRTLLLTEVWMNLLLMIWNLEIKLSLLVGQDRLQDLDLDLELATPDIAISLFTMITTLPVCQNCKMSHSQVFNLFTLNKTL